MVKLRAPKSKRLSSSKRHKIERKKREHKRDLRRAAKSLKKKGMAPKRNKKTREMAQLALKVSNAHPDKEQILNTVLIAREHARVQKKLLKSGAMEGEENEQLLQQRVAQSSGRKQLLFIPVKHSNCFRTQFNRCLDELVFPVSTTPGSAQFELPSVSYVVTLDSRFAVQCVPWSLIDAIVEREKEYKGSRKVLLLFVLTKAELVSAAAIVTQMSLLACALKTRYTKWGNSLVCSVTPFSTYYPRLSRHLVRMLNQFRDSPNCSSPNTSTNLSNKVCTIVIGLPNTGRSSLCKNLATLNESGVGLVSLKAAQVQLVKRDRDADEDDIVTRFSLPNARAVTLIQLPEDARLVSELAKLSGTDMLFRSVSSFEKQREPEVVGCVFYAAVIDRTALCQVFCQAVTNKDDSVKAGLNFMRGIGSTIRQEKGFHVSPLFSLSSSGTMGKSNSSSLTAHANFTSGQKRSSETLLDGTYSNATPSKLVRISSYSTEKRGKHQKKVLKEDKRNPLRMGARTFVREVLLSKNLPWAVMRRAGCEPVSEEEVANSAEMLNLALFQGHRMSDDLEKTNNNDHLLALVETLSVVLKDTLPFLPNNVVEFNPDSIVAPQYDLNDEKEVENEEDNYSAAEEEEEEEEEDETDEEYDEGEEEGEETENEEEA